MSFNWVNISDGEIASSVRKKINELGQYADDLVSVAENVSIPTTLWVSDSTYPPLAYKATISLSGITTADIVNVLFSQTDQASCNYAGGETGIDTITIYAITKPSSEIIVPQILIFKGVI